MSDMQCLVCGQQFTNANTFRSHKSRSAKFGTCKSRFDKKRANSLIAEMDPADLIEAVDKKRKHEKDQDNFDELKQMVGSLTNEIKNQNKKIDSLSKQNEELKDMMIDMQNNPRLLYICNNLYPLEELNLREPQFQPVLEILNKELPEYANLANDITGVVHAKAVRKLNTIKPTAIEENGNVFFKKENVLAKDVAHTTTKAFINAIGSVGYEYAQKASKDLESNRETDAFFQREVLQNAKRNSIPTFNDLA